MAAHRLVVAAGLLLSALGGGACSDGATSTRGPSGGEAGSMQAISGAGAGGGATAGAGSGGLSQSGGTSSGSAGAGTGGTSRAGAGSGGSGSGAAGASGAVSGGAGSAMAGDGGSGTAGTVGGAGSSGLGAGGGSAGVGGATMGGAAGCTASGSGGAGSCGAGADGGSATAGSGGSAGAAYQACPESGPCVIMPFGDSITEGFAVLGGYRSRLFGLALQDGRELTFVGSASNNGPAMVDGVPFPQNHEGHGGYTIDDEPARGTDGISPLVASSLGNYEPHIVLLMIGTNDLNGNIDVASAPNRLGALLDSIFAAKPSVLVILAQIVPTRTDGTNQTVQTYNAALPALVTARQNQGRHLVLVDMYGAFTRDQNYKTALLADNLHPNEAGYARMAATWYEALAEHLR